MFKKLCPNCHQPSFSSCDSGKWICPTCNNDLTSINLQDAQRVRSQKPQLFIIKKQFAVDNPKINTYNFPSFD